VPLSDLSVLRNSGLVKSTGPLELDVIGDSYVFKIRVELQNGWLMDYWEHKVKTKRRYSFHVFGGTRRRTMIVRWDNAPHHAWFH
jgi:Family of unknown function (DUF6516)